MAQFSDPFSRGNLSFNVYTLPSIIFVFTSFTVFSLTCSLHQYSWITDNGALNNNQLIICKPCKVAKLFTIVVKVNMTWYTTTRRCGLLGKTTDEFPDQHPRYSNIHMSVLSIWYLLSNSTSSTSTSQLIVNTDFHSPVLVYMQRTFL